jgi:hypothetical protein
MTRKSWLNPALSKQLKNSTSPLPLSQRLIGALDAAVSALRGNWIQSLARRNVFMILTAPLWLPLMAVRAVLGVTVNTSVSFKAENDYQKQEVKFADKLKNPVVLHRTANFNIDFSPLQNHPAVKDEKSFWKITEVSTCMVIATLKQKAAKNLGKYTSINIEKAPDSQNDVAYYQQRVAETLGAEKSTSLVTANFRLYDKTASLHLDHHQANPSRTYYAKHVYITSSVKSRPFKAGI